MLIRIILFKSAAWLLRIMCHGVTEESLQFELLHDGIVMKLLKMHNAEVLLLKPERLQSENKKGRLKTLRDHQLQFNSRIQQSFNIQLKYQV